MIKLERTKRYLERLIDVLKSCFTPGRSPGTAWEPGGGVLPRKPVMTGDGEPISGFKANTRNRILGVVTDRYKVVQNEEALSFTDELLGEGVSYEKVPFGVGDALGSCPFHGEA